MISKLLRFLTVLISTVIPISSANADQKLDPKPLKEIVESLCPTDSTGLFEEVLLAANEPKRYLEQFKDSLEERGIEEWKDVDYWIALIDGLERRGCLIESDWKTCGQDFGWLLKQLKRSSESGLDWSSLEKQGMEYKSTVEFASDVEKVLGPKHLSLVFLVFSSDSYALSLVSEAGVGKLRESAQMLSQRIEVFDKGAFNK